MKIYTTLLFTLIMSTVCFSQAKLGLKISPSLSSNRILSDDKTYDLENDGSALRFKFGLEADFPISDSYAFSTGLFYSPKRFAYKGTLLDANQAVIGSFAEEYKLQYIELPVTIKLFTNEIKPDTRVYVQTGGLFDIKVFEDHVEDDVLTEIRNFKPVDIAFVFGAGLEFKAGVNTLLFGGFSYERGLVNVIGKTEGLPDDISGRSDMLSLNLGVKF